MIPVLIILLFFFCLILIKATDITIIALRRIARQTKTAVFALSAIVLALGTSFPELFVGITSALAGVSSLSLGVVIGANIADITLVAGLAAFIVGRVNVQGDFLKKDVWVALVAGLLPFLLAIDGNLSRVDGLILLAVYGAYATSFFKGRFLEIGREHQRERFFHRFLRQINQIDGKKTKEYGRLFIGIALLLLSSDLIVRVAKSLALLAHIPVFVVGLVILSIGTTLPELIFSLRSLDEDEPSMFFGNLLGSVIANSTLVVGVASLLNPIKLLAVKEYMVAAITFVIVFLAFWWFIKTKRKLERWEAGILFLLYLVFVLIEFW